LLWGAEVYQKSGMPEQHAACFQWVANETRCIISCRSVGKYATQLLIESYATKGFHNKAKSCDWGPMAGFVLCDPTFSKRGTDDTSLSAQCADLKKAFAYGATRTGLYITERRLWELANRLGCLMTRVQWDNPHERTYVCRGKKFVVIRAPGKEGIRGQGLWSVNYAPGTEMYDCNMARTVATKITPVEAMVDPDCPTNLKGSPRSASTGDYDLFAIWPEKFAKALDSRPSLDTTARKKLPPDTAWRQVRDMGTITQRGIKIKDMLNQRVRSHGRYFGGDVVRHGDEAGRPSVIGIDFPWIAFVPKATAPFLIQHTMQFQGFVYTHASLRYHLVMNPGWRAALGMPPAKDGAGS
jgi:hypothetical protein